MAAIEGELSSARRLAKDLEVQLTEARRQYSKDREDWTELRRDLQTAVVVAETIRSEAQDALEALVVENKSLKDRNESLMRLLDSAQSKDTTRFPRTSSPRELKRIVCWLLFRFTHCIALNLNSQSDARRSTVRGTYIGILQYVVLQKKTRSILIVLRALEPMRVTVVGSFTGFSSLSVTRKQSICGEK